MGNIANEASNLESVAMRFGERRKFLAELAHACPGVLTHLSGDPFTIYQRVIKRDLPADWPSVSWNSVLHHVSLRDLASPADPLIADLADAISRWSRMFRLTDDWLVGMALETLGGWCLGLPRDAFCFMLFGAPNFLERRVMPGIFDVSVRVEDTWEWWDEDRDAIRRRMRAFFDRQLSERLNQIEADIKSCGFAYTPVKRGKAAKQHYEWLARHQVSGEDFSEIGRASGVTRQAVEQAVKETAALIDLALRDPDPGGRPRSRT